MNYIINYFSKKPDPVEDSKEMNTIKVIANSEYEVYSYEGINIEDHGKCIDNGLTTQLYLVLQINSLNVNEVKIKVNLKYHDFKIYIEPLEENENMHFINSHPKDFKEITLSLIVDIQLANKNTNYFKLNTIYNTYIFEQEDPNQSLKSDIKNSVWFEKLKCKVYLENHKKKQNVINKISNKKNENEISEKFNVEEIYKRMKIDSSIFQKIDNSNFDICETYPSVLYAINGYSLDFIKKLSNFRTKNRFPVLTYYYESAKTFILRSSQTKNGIGIGISYGNRSKEDEEYLSNFDKVSEKYKGMQLKIYDARSYSAACANAVR